MSTHLTLLTPRTKEFTHIACDQISNRKYHSAVALAINYTVAPPIKSQSTLKSKKGRQSDPKKKPENLN